ncbi:MAG TPA: BTAD domain-containing putative transcriptional regulator, partial [Gemmatimonadales bacterium]|nr:BTAD domain-containing putative transcriptional regulator [Gemmatimonadales bacterium]
MLRLRTFGGLALTGAAEPSTGTAAQRRPLALLALLAAAGEAGIARERLVALLWPGIDERRARSNLNQALYAVRRDLGEALVQGTTTLRLDPAGIACDLWEFERAVEQGDLEEAVALYAGPFLDGFTLAGAFDFERWARDERARLAQRHRDALEALARWAAEHGYHQLAVDRWRQVVALEPLSARAAAGLVRALAGAGDRTGALEHALEYGARVRAELGAEPDPMVEALARELRAAPAPAAPLAAGRPVFTPPPMEAPRARPANSARPRRSRRLALAGVAAALLVVVALVWRFARSPGAAAATHGDEATVAVLPFEVRAAPALGYLGEALAELLTTGLDGAGELRTVDPRAVASWAARRHDAPLDSSDGAAAAAQLDADLFVLGDVVESGGHLRVRAALYRRAGTAAGAAAGAPVARATAEGTVAELFAVADRLVAQLAAGRLEGDRLTRVAATSTTSLPALKAYLAAERDRAAERYAEAVAGYEAAVRADSTFALAYYRLSLAAELAGRDSLAERAAARALAHAGRLSPHDRQLVAAHAAARAGEHERAEGLYREIVDDYPDDREAWFQLGELLFHTGPLYGRSATESREAYEHVLQLDPDDQESLVHLARVAFLEGRRAEVDSLLRRVLALGPDAEVLELRAFRAFALSDREGYKRATRELLGSAPTVTDVSALQVAVVLDDLEGSERFARTLVQRGRSPAVQALGRRTLARLAVARGRWSEAAAQLAAVSPADSVSVLELHSLVAALPFLALPRVEVAAIRDRLRAWHPAAASPAEETHSAAHAGLHPLLRLHRLGLLDVALGDTAAALGRADSLARGARPGTGAAPSGAALAGTLAASVRAHVAIARGRPAQALALLAAAGWPRVAAYAEAEALDRFARAEQLRALGRDREALAWYATIAQRAAYELPYLAPAHRRQGEIYERLGDPAQALA